MPTPRPALPKRSPARPPRPDAVRPGVLVAVAAVAALLAIGTWAVVARVEGARGGELAADGETDVGGRRVALLGADDEHDDDGFGRVSDPGARGSVRDAWREAYEEGPPIGMREPLPPLLEAVVDPQLHTFHSMFGAESPPPFQPVEQRARLVSASGLDLDPNASCELRVLPVRDASYECLVRVMCGGRVVYPNPAQTAGYLHCSVDASGAVAGADDMPTTADGDPAIRMDPQTGRVRISNLDWNGPGSAFDVEIAVDPASMRTGV